MIELIHKLAKIYWKIFKPKTFGVRLILINDNKILLVEHSYTKDLYFPGGGVKARENFKDGLIREINEELGFEIKNLNLFGIYQNKKEGKIDTIVVFNSSDKINIEDLKTDREIKNFDFYDLENLPENISPGTRRRIDEYLNDNYPQANLW